MKNIYFLLKINRYIKSIRLKSLGIFLLHLFGKRYFGIFIDPVFACNLRCRMCYFSDSDKRKKLPHGMFSVEDIHKLANAFFHRALKLQIGCGAEPSLFPYNKELIRLGKEKKIPYISMTSNANRFSKKDWKELIMEGLNEITLSLHGIGKQSYEYFMTGASYESFCSSWQALTVLKEEYPHFKIRINYTVNKDNLQELSHFFSVFSDYSLDIIQIRPIQQLGNTTYQDFSWGAIYEHYDSIIEKLKIECSHRNIICLAPGKNDLIKTAHEQTNNSLVDSTFFYISPKTCWQNDFNLNSDTFESYSKRSHLRKKLFFSIFKTKKQVMKTRKQLNYEIS